MSDDKKYYYLKLKENFFDSSELIALESLQDGMLYSNILLKLYLRSLNRGGCLMLTDRIPYDTSILARVVRHPEGVVKEALKIFKELSLIEILDTGEIYMLDIQNYIGESSTEADRKRSYRLRIEQNKNGQMSGQMSHQMSRQKSTINRDRDKDKDIYIEDEKDTTTKNQSKKKKKFVPPTLEEVKAYVAERKSNVDAEYFFEYFDTGNWIDSQGKPVNNWKQKLISWERANKSKKPIPHSNVPEPLYKPPGKEYARLSALNVD